MLGEIANTISKLAKNIQGDTIAVKVGLFVNHQVSGWMYLGSAEEIVNKKDAYEIAKKLFDKVNGYGRNITYHNGFGYLIGVKEYRNYQDPPLYASVGGSFSVPSSW
jgi:hypothetical protein